MSRPTSLVDLASERLGGTVLAANDEFFAPKENLLKPQPAVSMPDKYTDRGKWMDGWETRRRRTPGHDWCILRLGLSGVIRSIIVDTAFFRGNYPSHCSVDACGDAGASHIDSLVWQPLLGQSELRGDAENSFTIERSHRFTHLRLNIFPDGGVARFRVMGEAMPDWPGVLARSAEIDLASIVNGAHIVDVSDRFFSEPANMLMPYPALNTGDGWETKRRRGPGHDSVVIRLATDAAITRVELDTTHFKGNYPESCDIEAAVVEELAGSVSADLTSTVIGHWKPLVPRTLLQPDHAHVFESELTPGTIASHVRLNIHPDGGVSRLRIFGVPTADGRRRAALRFLNSLDDCDVRRVLADYSAAPAWIREDGRRASVRDGRFGDVGSGEGGGRPWTRGLARGLPPPSSHWRAHVRACPVGGSADGIGERTVRSGERRRVSRSARPGESRGRSALRSRVHRQRGRKNRRPDPLAVARSA